MAVVGRDRNSGRLVWLLLPSEAAAEGHFSIYYDRRIEDVISVQRLYRNEEKDWTVTVDEV